MNKLFPNFKSTFLIVGFTFIFLALGLFSKGLMLSMAQFKVPEEILNSAHYADALQWVYIHMITLGILIVCLGFSVGESSKQKWIALILFLISSLYTYLDFRTSDSVLGNALYKGESSVAPAFISLLVSILFLQLSIRLFLSKK